MIGGLPREAVASLTRFGAQAAAMALTVPILVRELGDADYGLWILGWSLFGLAGLLDFGFGTAAVKLVAEDRPTDERNARLSTVLALLIGIAVLSVPAVHAVARFGVDLARVDAGRSGEIYTCLAVLGLRLVTFGIPLSFYRGVLFGGRHIVALSAVQAVASLALAAAVWATLTAGGGLAALATLNLAVMLVEHGAMAALAHRRIPDLRLSWRRCRWRDVPALYSLSFAFFLSGLAGAVLLRTDPIIVQIGGSLAAVAAYGLALKIVETAAGVIKQVTNLAAPRAARLDGARDLDALLLFSARLGAATAAAVAVPLVLLAGPLLDLWLGSPPEHTAAVLSVLALALLLSGAQLGASGVLAMSGAHVEVGRIAVASAVTNGALSLLLVGPFGALGVAGATLATTFAFDVFVLPALAAKRTRQGFGLLWKRVLDPLVAPASVWIAGFFTLRLSPLADHAVGLTLGAAVVAASTAAAAAVQHPHIPPTLGRLWPKPRGPHSPPLGDTP